MNLSRLKWIKVVTPPSDYEHRWAYSLKEIEKIEELGDRIIKSSHGLTIFPLGFKQVIKKKLDAGDLIMLTQHAKITHIVEVLDDESYEKESWLNRYVKIVWWKPQMDWKDLPHRSEILGFDIAVFDGNPHEFNRFSSFQKKWGDGANSLEAFQENLNNMLCVYSN